MDLGGYTGIPETLAGAQAMILELLDEQKRAAEISSDTLKGLNEATRMIEAARAALNAVEASPPTS